MASPTDRLRTVAVLAGGLALLALAVALARGVLPEWRAGELPARERFAERFREVAAEAGVDLAGSEPRLELYRGVDSGAGNPYTTLGAAGNDWLVAERRPILVKASGTGTTAEGVPVLLSVQLGLDGRPWNVAMTRATLMAILTPKWEVPLPTPSELLLRPGERLGEPTDGVYSGTAVRLYPVLPAEGAAGVAVEPPQVVVETALENAPVTQVGRGLGTIETAREAGLGAWWARALAKMATYVLLFFGVVVLAFVLALRRRIDLVNGAIVAALASAVSLAAAAASGALGSVAGFETVILVAFDAAFLFVLWATAESLLRDAGGEATNGLDLLRRGRVDRRVGRAVLWGLGAGAAAAAALLLGHALGTTAGALGDAFRPLRVSVLVPPFEAGRTPFDSGIRVAGEVLLALAVAHRLLPKRWVVPGAVALGTAVRLASSIELASLGAELVVGLAVVASLVAAYRSAGALAVLVAGLALYLVPALVFSALYADWLGGSLATASIAVVALAAVGFVGLGRSHLEAHQVEAPAFLARIEEERRVRYEMDLLARMQLGLLPEAVPEIAGWQVAARSMLAHEVGGDFYDFLHDESGRLWIAAGDVAGHGSFCSISHAMAKAALASLVAAERTPGEVLADADRVLRRLGTRRIFTSLALLRLDPETGHALLANAGYPFPLVRGGGRAGGEGAAATNGHRAVSEIELPGLPLGQGPDRSYADAPIELAPGDALVLASDGLFEARGRDGRPYGFDRYRAGLAGIASDSAGGILEGLLAHWRSEVGAGPLEDDTTVVVVRREA